MAKKILGDNDINNIIQLYVSGEMDNIHKLAKHFGVAHKRITKILMDNNVTLNKRGAKRKYPKNSIPIKYQEEIGYKYFAVHKDSGKTFSDYNNISGTLTKFLKKNYPEIEIPTLESEIREYYYSTGDYWYEQYFNIVKFSNEDVGYKNCPYCDVNVELGHHNIKYKNHLREEHNIDIIEHTFQYPEDKNMFQKEIKEIHYEENKDNWVECKICGEKMSFVNTKHLQSKHGITLSEYKQQFNLNKTPIPKTFNKILVNNMIENNQSDKMISYESNAEKEIKDLLVNNGIDVSSNRSLLNGREIDILSEEYKIGVEYNGLKWHTEFFGGKDKYYHLDKTIQLNEQGYNLIHIFEDEWVNKKDIVINKLKHLFNLNSGLIRVGARKCSIRPISAGEAINFLDKNHIQGGVTSSIYLGAYYEGILLAVMLFKRASKKNLSQILTRFVARSGYLVQGIASKMLSYFMKNYEFDEIISFADRRWTLDMNNNLYTKLGFELDKILPPDYSYYNENVDRYNRFHKFGFRKQILHKKYGLDLSLSETEMIKELGYDRIWDCGLLRYKL